MASISLTNIHKLYPNGHPAVRDVSLDIKDGEFMILLGPSGCGKSTTLRMIAGLETISAGDLHIGGKRMNDVDPADRDVAIVFQNYALYPHMTVADNLAFGLRLRGVATGIIAKRVAGIADMLGIGELLARKPAQLSGGQRQRVALGRALVREPQAFLLDEPLSNLDAKLRSSMRTELIKLHRTLGTTIVHVTHDQVEAMTMGERICIMKDGAIVQVGAPMEVYRNPADTFVAGFLASPPMNLLHGRLSAQGALLEDVDLPIPPPLRDALSGHVGEEVIIGLRPEDFHLQKDAVRESAAVEIVCVATEVLGPEVILVGAMQGAGQAEVHIRCPRDFRADPGNVTTFYFDLSELQLFDATTTKSLRRRPTV